MDDKTNQVTHMHVKVVFMKFSTFKNQIKINKKILFFVVVKNAYSFFLEVVVGNNPLKRRMRGRGRRRRRRKTKFIHHPLSFSSSTRASTVINKRLLQPNNTLIMNMAAATICINRFINSCCLPKPRSRYSIWSHTVLILPRTLAKIVTFFIFLPRRITRICMHIRALKKNS